MKKIVILGSGESGTGAALLAKAKGFDVFVSDKSAIKDQYKAELDAAGISWEENQHSLPKILKAKEVIKSPGIPEQTAVMQAIRAKGINVIGEIEFAFRYAGKCRIVGITGSNGKTTTTTLTQYLLHSAGLNSRMGGNVGNSFARMVLDDWEKGKSRDASRVFVLELSSFQLDDIQKFRPKIAILLNITPDHLDRYAYKLENYAAAKFRIGMNQKRGDVFIYNGFDPVLKENMPVDGRESKPKKIAIRKTFSKQGQIKIGKFQFDLTRTALRGPHNAFNAACALRTGLLLGADAEKMQLALQQYKTPPHRLELVRQHKGITWINDSKATNVDSVFYALQAMDTPTIWIAGGTDKGNDYSPILKLVRQKVKAIICMGLDNSKLIKTFKKYKKPMLETKSAVEAVQAAAQWAETGDTVLLSPACASFDLFKNYEDRGEQFTQAVHNLKS